MMKFPAYGKIIQMKYPLGRHFRVKWAHAPRLGGQRRRPRAPGWGLAPVDDAKPMENQRQINRGDGILWLTMINNGQ